MPKFLVTMNYVEAKRASFVIDAENEDDVYEGMGEIGLDFIENHENVKWVCSDYEPPLVDNVEPLSKKNEKMISCTVKQQKNIQKQFDKVIDSFNKAEDSNG